MNECSISMVTLLDGLNDVLAYGWLKYWDPKTNEFTDLPDPDNPWRDPEDYARSMGYASYDEMEEEEIPEGSFCLPSQSELRTQYPGIDLDSDLLLEAARDWCEGNRIELLSL